MLKEKGLFSNRYLRRGKENVNQGNGDDCDFPLAYTSNKYASKDRSPLSARVVRRDVKVEKQDKDKEKNIGKPEEVKS